MGKCKNYLRFPSRTRATPSDFVVYFGDLYIFMDAIQELPCRGCVIRALEVAEKTDALAPGFGSDLVLERGDPADRPSALFQKEEPPLAVQEERISRWIELRALIGAQGRNPERVLPIDPVRHAEKFPEIALALYPVNPHASLYIMNDEEKSAGTFPNAA